MGDGDLKRSKLQGLKFFKPLCKFLEELRQHHPHSNRSLHFDEYLTLLLLTYYNPAMQSLRGMVKLSDSFPHDRNLGLHHTSLGSLSEASHVFSPEPLRRIFLHLSEQASAADAPRRPQGLPEDLKLLAADATLWKLLPRMARELYSGPPKRTRKAELKGHFVFNVLDGVPEDVAFTPGAVDERQVLPKQLVDGALYVLDRGYQSKALFQSILDARSSFVARIKQDLLWETVRTNELSPQSRKGGAYSDEVATLHGMAAPLRVIRVRRISPPSRNLKPLHKRGKHAAPSKEDEQIVQEWVLLTDRLDMPAELIVEAYAYRWQIETFFRWLKVTLQCRHLLCESENGIELQMYAALIATLLVVVHSGRKPTKGLLQSIHLYLMGWTGWDQVEAEIKRSAPAKH